MTYGCKWAHTSSDAADFSREVLGKENGGEQGRCPSAFGRGGQGRRGYARCSGKSVSSSLRI